MTDRNLQHCVLPVNIWDPEHCILPGNLWDPEHCVLPGNLWDPEHCVLPGNIWDFIRINVCELSQRMTLLVLFILDK